MNVTFTIYPIRVSLCQFTPSLTLLRLNPDIHPHWLPNEALQACSDQPDQVEPAKPTEPARATTANRSNCAKPPWECRITDGSHRSQW